MEHLRLSGAYWGSTALDLLENLTPWIQMKLFCGSCNASMSLVGSYLSLGFFLKYPQKTCGIWKNDQHFSSGLTDCLYYNNDHILGVISVALFIFYYSFTLRDKVHVTYGCFYKCLWWKPGTSSASAVYARCRASFGPFWQVTCSWHQQGDRLYPLEWSILICQTLT